ncbi:MAG TPA: type I-MYXAN CRISPR-associated protein Cas6/Cmx6 [Gammaproteobacteria bacterium]
MNMFWSDEKEEDKGFKVPDDIVDLSFAIRCKNLPLDHAYALSQTLHAELPWLADEEAAGIHLIHVAESGNGWFRPQTENALLHLSRRTRMMLRIPKHRIDDARSLEGRTLDIDGYTLEVADSIIKQLSALSTLFARHVVMADAAMSEADFLGQVVAELKALNVPVRKILCGKSHDLRIPGGVIHTQSVMVADLEPETAVRLQQQGIGPGRKMGCGLFLPHKGIKPVKETH